MTLFVCLDENGGMSFNNRRQSSDRAVLDYMYSKARSDGKVLYASERSKKLLSKNEIDAVFVESVSDIPLDGFYFAEDLSFLSVLEGVDKIIVFRWHTVYPADVFFPLPLKSALRLSSVELETGSHGKVTVEEHAYR